MEKTVKLSALLVANQIDLRAVKTFLDVKASSDSSTGLLYHFDGDKYRYYFNYGVVVFSDHSEEEIKEVIKVIEPFTKHSSNWLRDDHEIMVDARRELEFQFDRVIVNHLDFKVVQIAMLHLAQSVALEHYNEVCENLLAEVKVISLDLETNGRISLSRKNMLKFIGKALNTQIDIADNIYIFDTPELVWEDEYADRLYKGLMKYFDLPVRFSEIEYTLKIIESNLHVFREITNQRQSTVLEWIVIILIMIEVFDILLSKLL
ncbi:RMD1 family protein [soil metagenome]